MSNKQSLVERHMERVQLENSEQWLVTHDATICRFPDRCAIHARTDHAMRGFTQHWRGDRGLMERTCPHGIGHPDPDTAYFMKMVMTEREYRTEMIHGCDGCCAGCYK
jgi:hypothetical protein